MNSHAAQQSGLLFEDPANVPLSDALHAAARNRPDAPSLIAANRTYSWAQLDDEVQRLAALLVNLGVEPGDPVGIMTSKRAEVVTTFLACARMGAILSPVNFKLHHDAVLDQFKTANIRCVLAEKQFDPLLEQLSPVLTDRDKIIYVGKPGSFGRTNYSSIGEVPLTSNGFTPEPDTVCYYNYTSGTTGRPKGAITTNRNIQVNALSGIQGYGFNQNDVFMGMFSVFSHPHELFHRSLLVGGPFVVFDTMSPRITLQLIEKHRITWMMAVPSFYEMILDRGGIGKSDISSLRVTEAGGAYVSAETLHKMERHFQAYFMPVWGSTETTGVALAMPLGQPRLPGATGIIAPYYDVRVVDDSGAEAPTGTIGEMLMKSDAVANGYHNLPEESASHFVDGWYHTGDLVVRDADGWIHFKSRRSDMLKVGGIRVYPLQLEQVMKTHPDITEAVVVRHEERLRGEVPRAIITTLPGSTLDPKGVKAFCRDRLAVYQVPRIIEFWKEIPRLPNGKIDKKGLEARPVDPLRDER